MTGDHEDAIRNRYAAEGVRPFYEQSGDEYRNPHEDAIAAVLTRCVQEWPLDLSRVLDLACGSGEATLALKELGAQEVVGVDPFTQAAYKARTGSEALPHSFEDIATGVLSGETFSLIVCSYALHLLEPSRLPQLLFRLAEISPALLILSPHKRPEIHDDWGWKLTYETYRQRVRARLFQASNLPSGDGLGK